MHQVNLTKYGKGVYHMGVKIYNGLPYNLKVISNDTNKFKVSLKEFLYLNSFYTLEEFVKSLRLCNYTQSLSLLDLC